MPALSYHAQFAQAVEAGQKLQTIRAMRKVPVKAGDTLYHYTGMRTKACRKLGVSFCQSANQIDIFTGRFCAVFLQMSPGGGQHRLTNYEITALAKADGFSSRVDFLKWFGKDCADLHHFSGQLITWASITPF
jgi:hypothetical protein